MTNNRTGNGGERIQDVYSVLISRLSTIVNRIQFVLIKNKMFFIVHFFFLIDHASDIVQTLLPLRRHNLLCTQNNTYMEYRMKYPETPPLAWCRKNRGQFIFKLNAFRFGSKKHLNIERITPYDCMVGFSRYVIYRIVFIARLFLHHWSLQFCLPIRGFQYKENRNNVNYEVTISAGCRAVVFISGRARRGLYEVIH